MLQERGEETPLDHIPTKDLDYDWFSEAYYMLMNSKTESGSIPLSELDLYARRFGLIGEFDEFAEIIYALNRAHNKSIAEKRDKAK